MMREEISGASTVNILANVESDAKNWRDSWDKVRDLKPSGQSKAMEARRKNSAERACVKVLKDQNRAERRSRFYREAVILASLGGNGLPFLIETNAARYGDRAYNLYLVIEYVEGEDLTEYVSEDAFSAREAIELAIEICEILKVAHAEGVFHRDIKPDNVKIRDQKGAHHCRVSLLDFGIAFFDDEQGFDTQTDQEIGNRFLRLPEFAPGSDQKDDPRSDVTMVAGLLFFMLTGKKPATLVDHNGRLPHQRAEARNRLLQCGLDKDALLGIFDRAFRDDIAKRFQSISEFEGSLLDLLAREELAVGLISAESVLERLAHSSSQEVLNRKAVLSSLLQEADRELRQHYAQFRHGIVMAQTDRQSDPQAGSERTVLIFSMGARPEASIRVGLSATAVGAETKISIQTEGCEPMNLRVPIGAPFNEVDRQMMRDYLTMVLDILTRNQDGIDDSLRAAFRQRAEDRAYSMVEAMGLSIADYLESEGTVALQPVTPPIPHKSRIASNSAIAQVAASCRLPDDGGYLHILGLSKVMVELWPDQKIIHSSQTLSARITPGPSGGGSEEYLNGPVNTIEPFRPSVEDVGALVARTKMNRQ